MNVYINLSFKYTSRLSMQILWQKSGIILYCLNMSCGVIVVNAWIFMLDIRCQFDNVSLKCLKQSSQVIIHLSSFRLNTGAK